MTKLALLLTLMLVGTLSAPARAAEDRMDTLRPSAGHVDRVKALCMPAGTGPVDEEMREALLAIDGLLTEELPDE